MNWPKNFCPFPQLCIEVPYQRGMLRLIVFMHSGLGFLIKIRSYSHATSDCFLFASHAICMQI